MSTLLRHCGSIYTCDDHDTVLANGFLRMEAGRITDIGVEPYGGPPADVSIQLPGEIVLPGLINTHHHFFQTLTKAVAPAMRATGLDWLFQMYPIWACFEAEDFAIASELAAAELLLSGATTSVDHSYLHPDLGAETVPAQIEAVRSVGLRQHFVRGSMVTIEGDLETRLRAVMGADVNRLLDGMSGVLDATRKSIRRYHDPSNAAMVRMGVGPTGVTYSSPEMMRASATLAADHGCGLHTHYHPRDLEREMSKRLVGGEPLGFLKESGWIGPHTWMAHGTQLTDLEIDTFAAHSLGVAHCPHTIVRLGYHATPVGRLRRAGVPVGIGVDGSASNDRNSMITDMRLALLLNRVNSPTEVQPERDWLDAYDVLTMATRDGARILGRTDIGSISVGRCADITAFPLTGIHYAGAVSDPLTTLLLAGCDSRASTTIVNGELLVMGGELTRVAESTLVSRANEAAQRILHVARKRYPKATAPASSTRSMH